MRKQLLGISLLLALHTASASLTDQHEKSRESFVKAEAALKAGDSASFKRLKNQLTAYPLFSYLEYWQLKKNLGKARPGEVQAFLDKYADQPVADRLRISWLHKLGQRRDWSSFLKFYRPQSSTTLQCYEVRARLSTGDREQALNDTLDLWLGGHSQPDACDPAFDQLYASNKVTSRHIWERIRLAFANQKSALAGFLAKRLSNRNPRPPKDSHAIRFRLFKDVVRRLHVSAPRHIFDDNFGISGDMLFPIIRECPGEGVGCASGPQSYVDRYRLAVVEFGAGRCRPRYQTRQND